MRMFFLLTLLWLGAGLAASGDEQVVEQFDGHNSLTTSDFTVPDHWEIRWHSAQALSIGVIRLDNTVVAGATGANNGSLYLPKGGSYRLRVKGEDPIPWDIAVVALGPDPSNSATGAKSSSFYVPTTGPEFVEDTNTAPVTNSAPAAPDTNTPPPAPPPVATQLTAAQERAVVVVKGDREEGAGFLLMTASGPVVITCLRLISDNPHLEITTQAGSDVKMKALQCAPDRDMAMIGIQNNGYSCLDAAGDIAGAVQPGDPVLTAASSPPTDENPQGAQVITVTPKRIEIGDFQDHGEIGGPVLQAKLGRMIAMVDAIPQIAITTDIDKTSFPSREAAVANSRSYFGLRFDTVTHWETCDWKRFNIETAFLDAFPTSTAWPAIPGPRRNFTRPTRRSRRRIKDGPMTRPAGTARSGRRPCARSSSSWASRPIPTWTRSSSRRIFIPSTSSARARKSPTATR